MNFSLLILCVSFILILFSVGESVYNQLKVKRLFILITVLALILFRLIPNITISSVQISVANFILPLIISVFLCVSSLRSLKSWVRFFVSTLIVVTLTLVYNVIEFNIYEGAFVQPYVFLGLVLGLLSFLVCQNSKIVFASCISGLTISEIIFYKSRYGVYGFNNLVFGTEMMICTLLIAFIFSLLCQFAWRKIKYAKRKKAFKNKQIIG